MTELMSEARLAETGDLVRRTLSNMMNANTTDRAFVYRDLVLIEVERLVAEVRHLRDENVQLRANPDAQDAARYRVVREEGVVAGHAKLGYDEQYRADADLDALADALLGEALARREEAGHAATDA